MTSANFVLPQQLQQPIEPKVGYSKWFWLAGFAIFLLGIYWLTNC